MKKTTLALPVRFLLSVFGLALLIVGSGLVLSPRVEAAKAPGKYYYYYDCITQCEIGFRAEDCDGNLIYQYGAQSSPCMTFENTCEQF